MLKTRVIPTLLWKNVGLVKGIGFDSWRRVGPVLPAVKVYNSRDVDELILLDITATAEGRTPDHESIGEFSSECTVPLTVGGGITNLSTIARLLHVGADKIALNSVLYSDPDLVDAAAGQFGAQCVVVSIDVRRRQDGSYTCLSRAGTRDEERGPVDVAREMAARGGGEILLTSVDRDGAMIGYDLEVIGMVADAVTIPVIASGGAGNYRHMIDAVVKANASAVAAASIFHFTEQTPTGAKAALAEAGIPIRRNLTPQMTGND
jgi:cyclase